MRTPSLPRLLLALALTATVQAQTAAQPDLERIIAAARLAQPPAQPEGGRTPDLVDLATLDATLHFDIRYATGDNFLHHPVYDAPKAFLQRPVAEALVRANARLRASGHALRIHDAYRPWWVTKVFWDATPPADRAYVADPAKGSVHNRGCAVDLDLVDLVTGAPASMPSGYDEMSPRAHADYAGGDPEARRHRDLLRAAMEAEGFSVLKEEWWHFDHASSAGYPVMNLPLLAIRSRAAELAGSGQLLLVTTSSWNAPQGHLQRFERQGDAWTPVGPPQPVWIGASGLAWRSDDGAPVPPAPGPTKREGDGRSPAGLLTFGGMWGYAPAAPDGVRLPYRMSTECDRCVDDPDHPDYGHLVRLPSPAAPVTFASAEHLRLPTEHYRFMVVIHYNDLRPVKRAGSCIFLHVAPPPGRGTAGCTALPADDLLALLRWMDPARHPLLLQVPAAVLPEVRAAWGLPPELHPTAP